MSEFRAPSFPSSDLHGGSVVTGRQLSKAMGMHVLPFSELRIGPPCFLRPTAERPMHGEEGERFLV
jgi:hypothetical protein